MEGLMHIDLTRRVALVVLGEEDAANEIATYADFPDRVDDIVVEGIGTSIVGKRLCSLTHFPVPMSMPGDDARLAYRDWRTVAFRGYAWKSDTSVPSIDLPNRDVRCYAGAWGTAIGERAARERPPPLATAVRAWKERGLRVAADEIAYPDAVAMASWLGGIGTGPAIGCALHFVQDAAVYHHARGWLLRGHSTQEANLSEVWFGAVFRSMRDRLVRAQRTNKRKMSPEEATAKNAMFAYFNAAPIAEIRCAISRTAAVLRWWKDQA